MGNYCVKCGKENKPESRYCQYCGTLIKEDKEEITTVIESPKTNAFALAGFITALASTLINFGGVVAIVATVLSGIGLSQVNSKNEKGKGFAIAGLIIGIFGIIYGLFSILFLPRLIDTIYNF